MPAQCLLGRFAAIAALTVISIVAAGAADPELLYVEAHGRAEGLDDAALASAIESAKQNAVCDAVAAWAPARGQVLCDRISAEAGRFVPAYRLLEQAADGGRTVVRIEASVDYEALRERTAAALLAEYRDPPRLVLAIIENEEEDAEAVLQAADFEAALRERLVQEGLDVASALVVEGLYDPAQLESIATDGEHEAGKLARTCLTDLALVGELRVVRDEAMPGGNLKPTKADLTVRLVRGTDNRLITAHATTALVRTLHAEEGRRVVLDDLAAKLAQRIATEAALAMAAPGGEEYYTITLEAPVKEERLEEVLDAVRKLSATREVETLHRSNLLARFRVHYVGGITELIELLTRTRFSEFRLEPLSVVGREWVFRMTPLNS